MFKKILLAVCMCAFSLSAAATTTITIRSSGILSNAYGGTWPFGDGPFMDVPYELELTSQFTAWPESSVAGAAVGHGTTAMTLTIGGQTLTFAGISSLQRVTIADNQPDWSGQVGDMFMHQTVIPIGEYPRMEGGSMHLNFTVSAGPDYLDGNTIDMSRTLDGTLGSSTRFYIDTFTGVEDLSRHSYTMIALPSSATITITSSIPEPSQSGMLVLGLLVLASYRYRKHRA